MEVGTTRMFPWNHTQAPYDLIEPQVATRMNKQFQDDRYLYWTVISTVLQVRAFGRNDPM